MTPTTEPAQRIAIMFNRRLTTPWSDKEIKAYRILVKDRCFTKLDDLGLLERYYAFERRKGDKGFHRRDLPTFLNNYRGELDRARYWDAKHKVDRCRQMLTPVDKNGQKPVSDEEFRRLGQLARKELQAFKTKFYNGNGIVEHTETANGQGMAGQEQGQGAGKQAQVAAAAEGKETEDDTAGI